MYKILAPIITERAYNFLDNNNILPTEQKVCKRGSYGCKDQLLRVIWLQRSVVDQQNVAGEQSFQP